MLFNEKVIKYDEKCKILIKSRYKVKSPLSEKVTYNLYLILEMTYEKGILGEVYCLSNKKTLPA